jgi:putative FmdB family regulatory protein
MPIYEYRCGKCKRKFEQIVLRGRALEEARCPKCGSRTVERLLSSFAMSGVSRKSEESFDDDFGADSDDLGDDLGAEEFGGGAEDDLGGEDDSPGLGDSPDAGGDEDEDED